MHAGDTLPPAFSAAAAEMPEPLRSLLVDNLPPENVDGAALAEAMSCLPLAVPMGRASDVLCKPGLLDAASCAALRTAVDERGLDTDYDTVDGVADHQLNMTPDELSALIGKAQLEAIIAAGRELDMWRGGSGSCERLPLVEVFVRRYTPHTRPWHPFHQDRAAITVNVALSDDCAHGGGRLVGIFADGAAGFERSEGCATVHLSRIVHGVTRMTHGIRHALIVFLGHEPAVRRELVTIDTPDGPVQQWNRVIVE